MILHLYKLMKKHHVSANSSSTRISMCLYCSCGWTKSCEFNWGIMASFVKRFVQYNDKMHMYIRERERVKPKQQLLQLGLYFCTLMSVYLCMCWFDSLHSRMFHLYYGSQHWECWKPRSTRWKTTTVRRLLRDFNTYGRRREEAWDRVEFRTIASVSLSPGAPFFCLII